MQGRPGRAGHCRPASVDTLAFQYRVRRVFVSEDLRRGGGGAKSLCNAAPSVRASGRLVALVGARCPGARFLSPSPHRVAEFSFALCLVLPGRAGCDELLRRVSPQLGNPNSCMSRHPLPVPPFPSAKQATGPASVVPIALGPTRAASTEYSPGEGPARRGGGWLHNSQCQCLPHSPPSTLVPALQKYFGASGMPTHPNICIRRRQVPSRRLALVLPLPLSPSHLIIDAPQKDGY